MSNTENFIYCAVFFIGCHFSFVKIPEKKYPEVIKEINPLKNEGNSARDTVNFLKDCDKLMKRSWQGSLQGTFAGKDSTGYLCFAACFDCRETYEIIFTYKGGVEQKKSTGYKELWKIFKGGCMNNFEYFDCFAFVISMKDPEKQDDIHKTRYSFPSIVKAYKRVDSDNWKLVTNTSVNNFKAFGDLRFKVIYGIY